MSRLKITVAVSGLNATDNPGSGVPVIRALKESTLFDVKIIGLSYEVLEPGIYMPDLVYKTYQVPPPANGIDMLFKRLKEIHSQENIQIIIPNFDSEILNYIRLSPRLETEFGIKCVLPNESQFNDRQKTNLHEFTEGLKLKTPKQASIFNAHSLFSLVELHYPLMIKGKYYDAFAVYSAEEAASAYRKLASKWGNPVIAQQMVHGEELNVTAIGDGKGKMLGAVIMKKLYITDKGKGWAGVSIEDKRLLEHARELISRSKWRGGLELEIIRNEKGDYMLIEINPRFPAWIYFAAACGQNHPEKLIQLALGQEVIPDSTYEVGKLFVRYSQDLIVDLKDFETISTKGELQL